MLLGATDEKGGKMDSQTLQYLMLAYPLVISLGLGGGVLAMIYSVVNHVYYKIRSKLWCSVEIKYDDDMFKWVNKFMQDEKLLNEQSTLKAGIKKDKGEWWELIFNTKDDKKKPDVEFKPGAGNHFFSYNKQRFWLYHDEGDILITGGDRTPTQQEKITITTFGQDTQPIKDFIDAAVVHNMDKDSDKIGIYEQHRWGIGWTKA